MRKLSSSLILIVMLFGVVSIFGGCGDSDILDEPEDSYIYSMELMDNDTEGTLTVDIVQVDCDGNGTFEDYTDLFAILTVSVAETATGISLDHYRIEYIPLASADSNGNLVTAPTVGSPLVGYANVDIASGETGTFTITFMTVDTKSQMAVDSGVFAGIADPFILRYRLRVTLYFEDYGGEDEEFVIEKTVYFSNYNNC